MKAARLANRNAIDYNQAYEIESRRAVVSDVSQLVLAYNDVSHSRLTDVTFSHSGLTLLGIWGRNHNGAAPAMRMVSALGIYLLLTRVCASGSPRLNPIHR
jgi:hypothetical protein